jgi:hypothetical protein
VRLHQVTMPDPRCPLCHVRMEEAQLKWEEIPGTIPPRHGWHEVWGCSSCHTNHVFPARIEMLEYVRNSQQLPMRQRVIYLPK